MVSQFPTELRYTKEDEWIRIDGNTATIGITHYAQDQLGDIVYLEIPEAGSELALGEAFGVVESVKAVADLYMPLSGTIVEANEELADMPETINTDPYTEGWMIKIELSNPDELNAESLMSAEAYIEYCKER